MKIIPLASDSMGVRSMATFIETTNCRILIDPGASIVPLRYGFGPHPMETWRLKKLWERIHLFAQTVDIIVNTHYHPSHFMPDMHELYRGKSILIKNPNQHIVPEQRNLAFRFLNTIQPIVKEVSFADARKLTFDETSITFSPPVMHDFDKKKGYVIQVHIENRGKTFLFTSDVQGPCDEEASKFIIEQNPEFLYLDGPLTYLQGDESRQKQLGEILDRVKHIVEKTRLHRLMIDHHLLRDVQWREKFEPVFEFAHSKGVLVITAAEFRGEENNPLEARRNQLFENDSSGASNSSSVRKI